MRYGSILLSFRINLKTTLKSIYYFSLGFGFTSIIKLAQIKKGPLLELKKIIFLKIKQYFVDNPIKLGGPNIIVQIDETKLNFNVKNHRGRNIPACWALVIVDNFFVPALRYSVIFENRSAEVLLYIINQIVIPRSIIVTDEWKSYSSLNELNIYQHQTVCHKYCFVDRNTGTHTQNVKSYNNKLRLAIKKTKGLNLEQRKVFLQEFLYREHHSNDKFTSLIKLFEF